MKFKVEFYETADGQKPVEEFLISLDDKMRAKLVHMMELLEEKGTELRSPYTKPLNDGIFELRCRQSSNITRALFSFILVVKLLLPMDSSKRHKKRQLTKYFWRRKDGWIIFDKRRRKNEKFTRI